MSLREPERCVDCGHLVHLHIQNFPPSTRVPVGDPMPCCAAIYDDELEYVGLCGCRVYLPEERR